MDNQLEQAPELENESYEDAAATFPGDEMEENLGNDSGFEDGQNHDEIEGDDGDRRIADGLPDESADHEALSHHGAAASPEERFGSGSLTEPLTALTMGDFEALEERVLRAVSMIHRERHARLAAEERLLLAESQMLASAPVVEQLQQENDALRAERDQVRLRVERLLSQLDSLEV